MHQAAPVTNAAASLARNATTGAMSAGEPSRDSGTVAISAARAACEKILRMLRNDTSSVGGRDSCDYAW